MTKQRPDIILHIGRAKTGSTALQSGLFNSAKVLARAGLRYITPADRNINSNFFFDSIGKAQESPVELGGVKKEFSQFLDSWENASQLTIISAEAAQNLRPEMVKDLFSGFKVQVVCWVRNELEWMASAYAQRVKTRPDFRVPVADWIASHIKNNIASHERFLNLWGDVWGEDFMPRIYGSESGSAFDVTKDFSDWLSEQGLVTRSLALEAPPPASRYSNPSISHEVLLFVLEGNVPFTLGDWEPRVQLVELSRIFPGKFRLPPEVCDQLRPLLSQRAQKWGARFFGQTEVFDYDRYEAGTSLKDWQLTSERREAISAVYEALL